MAALTGLTLLTLSLSLSLSTVPPALLSNTYAHRFVRRVRLWRGSAIGWRLCGGVRRCWRQSSRQTAPWPATVSRSCAFRWTRTGRPVAACRGRLLVLWVGKYVLFRSETCNEQCSLTRVFLCLSRLVYVLRGKFGQRRVDARAQNSACWSLEEGTPSIAEEPPASVT